MALNKFPGFCRDCDRAVGAGHGDLTRSARGAWVVTHAASAPKAPAKPAAETADEDEAREDVEAAGPAPRTATYHRLYAEGPWGIKGPADLRQGEVIVVRKRDGSMKRETVASIMSRTTEATIATIMQTTARASGTYAPRRRRTYDSPGGIDGRGCGYPGCDGVRFCDDCSE